MVDHTHARRHVRGNALGIATLAAAAACALGSLAVASASAVTLPPDPTMDGVISPGAQVGTGAPRRATVWRGAFLSSAANAARKRGERGEFLPLN
jgi:hypothetical protein